MLHAVVEQGSMARAASALGLTQPAISKAIAEMERLLGVPLLERSPRGVVPTRYGTALLARGAAMLDELRQGIEELRFLADPTQGQVRIGATEPMTTMVAGTVDRLGRRHPRMRFEVEVAPTHELLAGLRERRLDIAVTRMAAADSEPDLRVEVLFDDPLAVLADRSNPLLRRRRLALRDLLDQPWAIPPPDTFIGNFIAQAFGSRGLEPPRAQLFTRSVQMWIAMIRTGRFLAVGPSAMLRFPRQYPALAALPVALPETRRPVGLVSLAGRAPTPAAVLVAEDMVRAQRTNEGS